MAEQRLLSSVRAQQGKGSIEVVAGGCSRTVLAVSGITLLYMVKLPGFGT